jgi:tight adherence protein B
VRARFSILRQLRVYTAQGRLSGYVLGVMPIAVAAAIFAMNPEYASKLVTEPFGRFMVMIALVMQIIGYLWIRRIVNIEI